MAMETLREQVEHLVPRIQEEPSLEILIQNLQEKERYLFFRMAIINAQGELLYDSHAERLNNDAPTEKSQARATEIVHPEVLEALQKGWGYNEEYSKLLQQDLVYVAKSFLFHNQLLVLRTAFPLDILKKEARWLELGFIGLNFVLLLLFGFFSSMMIYRFTQPIRRIIRLIRPYYQGTQSELPYIPVHNSISHDDFDKLSVTLNQLSDKIKSQFNNLIQERNEKNAMLESLIEGIVAINDERVITYANTSAVTMFGKLRHELLSYTFHDLGEKECDRLLAECQDKQTVLSDLLYLQSGANANFFQVSAIPLPEHKGAVLIINNQTEQYKVLQLHKDFIANASHELKTPITIIQGFAETLNTSKNIDLDKIRIFTDKILHHTERLNQIINSCLTLSKIENKQLVRRQECRLVEIAKKCRDILLTSYPDATIILEFEQEQQINISGEPQLIEVAIMNLMENGLKYSPSPATLKVSFGKSEQEKCTWLAIEDKGVGIPDDDLPHIFERFYRVDKARSRKAGGAGLGLSIVQLAIQKHNGAIAVKSNLGEGTTFIIKFY
ncbi:MAG: phoR [Chlamydiales bacterium]|nr:phoR [Chlamydiales bacterium]